MERSPEARRRAERALVMLARALEPHDTFFVVFGGLLPQILARGSEHAPEHLGTTDVDVFLAIHVDADNSLMTLERTLVTLDFEPDLTGGGWRWRAHVDGAVVKVEFLCDLGDRPAMVPWRPAGCSMLSALNLRGTGFVAEDWSWRELDDGTGGFVRVRFAGLEGYLMTKVHSARERGADKDYYDLVYTLMFNARARPADAMNGPASAGQMLANGTFGPRIDLDDMTWRELAARFADADSLGARGYASEASMVDRGADAAVLRQDAVGAVAEFLDAIRGAIER